MPKEKTQKEKDKAAKKKAAIKSLFSEKSLNALAEGIGKVTGGIDGKFKGSTKDRAVKLADSLSQVEFKPPKRRNKKKKKKEEEEDKSIASKPKSFEDTLRDISALKGFFGASEMRVKPFFRGLRGRRAEGREYAQRQQAYLSPGYAKEGFTTSPRAFADDSARTPAQGPSLYVNNAPKYKKKRR